MLPQVEQSLKHISQHRDAYLQDRAQRHLPNRPFIVGVSGCQGSGKTTLCDTLVHLLSNEPHNLSVVSFSLDDFYLTRNDQANLAATNPNNKLLQVRGQPGSHDLPLARSTFTQLLDPETTSVAIPSYDKSCFGGLGDRRDKSQWKTVYAPYDVILFEGWSQGFKPLPPAELKRMYQEATGRMALQPLASLEQINRNLAQYEDDLYAFFDIFIHLSPADPEQVYNWRLQQEHHMKSTRSVDGMSDESVRAFVDTYMPAYELYLPRLDRVGFFGQGLRGETLKPYEGQKRADGGYSGLERHLRLVLDQERRVIRTQHMKETVLVDSPKIGGGGSGDGGSGGGAIARFSAKRFLFSCAMIGLLSLGISRRRRIIDAAFKLAGAAK
ncbi:P-loop containing nucleoside triphosphate hydrolase protein [Zychaea mexicana]|uniref:P-loop containing nucleoside triphosphate hydrolase protein n=1 Tax=Zychaea mexicana TaxID=64656 RepID=UPI0022FEC9E1|nr:P-loop containing nucleoside triphosphate hydrolase protein [Zychaea mexicana]KAI9485109.1 P-loop containing nucleoside triphosphate hydrolase protein [Zychaea mexicana]